MNDNYHIYANKKVCQSKVLKLILFLHFIESKPLLNPSPEKNGSLPEQIF